jgi:hypothetical protein
MPSPTYRPLIGSLALGLLLAACASGQGPAVESGRPRATATPAVTASWSPVASPSDAPPSPAPTRGPTPDPLAALVHCSGTASGGLGASVHRQSTWSGYVAAASPGTVSCVEGAWIEPAVSCGTVDSALLVWVGIGGYTSVDIGITDDGRSMEEAGTGIDCENGVATHYAWHQVDPRQPHDLPFPGTARHGGELLIFPGDRIWAQVRYAGGTLHMTVANLTSGDVREVREADAGRHRSSAEWIVRGEDDLPIPAFGAVALSAGSATLAGTLGSIGSTAWHRNEVDEWRDGVARLRVSGLSAGGASFSVSWAHG